jgi:hypothetical protein
MNCEKCSKPNSPQAKFCGKCGFAFKALVSESAALEGSMGLQVNAPSKEPTTSMVEQTHHLEPLVEKSSSLQAEPGESGVEPIAEFEAPLVVETSHVAGDLKALINSQFHNNYSNQAAIKKYLDAHTEQLKAITFQLESVKNFQATINYELIINEINDKYKAIVQRIDDRDAGILSDPTQSLGHLLDDVDEKTHFLFEKINALLISHNQQLMNNFESILQNVHHQNDSTFALLENQLATKNADLESALGQAFQNFETKAVQENINLEAKLLDSLTELKQQSKDADHELLERLSSVEELISSGGLASHSDAAGASVDVISKQMKSLALTSHEKLSNLILSSQKTLSIEIASDVNEILDERMKSLKLDLEKSLAEIKKDKHLSKEMFKSVVSPSEFNPEGSDGWITFLTGLLSGCAVVLASLAIYNFVAHSSDTAPEKTPKAAISKSQKH